MSTKDAGKEVILYRDHAIEADRNGQHSLALRWRIAADAAYLFSRQQQQNLPAKTKEESSFAFHWKHQVLATQEAAQQIIQALAAAQKKDIFKAHHWKATAEGTTEAASCYQHWMTLMKKRTIPSPEEYKHQSLQEALSYRMKAWNAQKEKVLSQHWAEAACLAQDAASKFSMAHELGEFPENELFTLFWRIAAQESMHAAHLKANLAEATAAHQEVLLPFWNEAASWREESMMHRGRAIHAAQARDEKLLTHWSLLAYWASLTSEINMKIISLFPSQCPQPLFSYWEDAAQATKNSFRMRSDGLNTLKNNKNRASWNQALSLLEHATDCRIKAAEIMALGKKEDAAQWQKRAQQAEGHSFFLVKTTKRNRFGIIPFPFIKITP